VSTGKDGNPLNEVELLTESPVIAVRPSASSSSSVPSKSIAYPEIEPVPVLVT